MGDEDDGAVGGGESANAVERFDLGLRVECGGGFVHDEDAVGLRGRAAPVGTGQSHFLSFTALEDLGALAGRRCRRRPHRMVPLRAGSRLERTFIKVLFPDLFSPTTAVTGRCE